MTKFKIIDGNNNVYMVYEYQEYVDASSNDGYAQIPGLKSLSLADGRSVVDHNNGAYSIVGRPLIQCRRL